MKSKAENKPESASPFGKRYDLEFRKEAVGLLEAGRSAAQLSRELGVSTWTLGVWKKQYGLGAAAAGTVGQSPKGGCEGSSEALAFAAEVARLRSELHTVTRQREILKKALSILGQDTPHSTI